MAVRAELGGKTIYCPKDTTELTESGSLCTLKMSGDILNRHEIRIEPHKDNLSPIRVLLGIMKSGQEISFYESSVPFHVKILNDDQGNPQIEVCYKSGIVTTIPITIRESPIDKQICPSLNGISFKRTPEGLVEVTTIDRGLTILDSNSIGKFDFKIQEGDGPTQDFSYVWNDKELPQLPNLEP